MRALPGIGAYTAAAVAAIAFDRPASPVDGNIARIMTRLHAIDAPIAKAGRAIAAAAAALTPHDRPGDFAQALMDIGAMICTPRKPDCPACPLRSACARRRARRAARLSAQSGAQGTAGCARGAAFFAEAGTAACCCARGRRRDCSARRWNCRARPGRADFAAREAALRRALCGALAPDARRRRTGVHAFSASAERLCRARR